MRDVVAAAVDHLRLVQAAQVDAGEGPVRQNDLPRVREVQEGADAIDARAREDLAKGGLVTRAAAQISHHLGTARPRGGGLIDTVESRTLGGAGGADGAGHRRAAVHQLLLPAPPDPNRLASEGPVLAQKSDLQCQCVAARVRHGRKGDKALFRILLLGLEDEAGELLRNAADGRGEELRVRLQHGLAQGVRHAPAADSLLHAE
mmetsp:Transcript_6091/g.15691  ORF Transcript_6091/g.15691 Transcript_6091/m.15691 type:complete len:204 (+) Transcript_6091:616-1227(+)